MNVTCFLHQELRAFEDISNPIVARNDVALAVRAWLVFTRFCSCVIRSTCINSADDERDLEL